MSITSPLPYFVLMLCFIGFATWLTPDRREVTGKLHVSLEALRGLLATSVFFTHAVITYFYFQKGEWNSPPSGFYVYLGSAPVTIFFFLSGFLFWSKCISDGGIRDTTAWLT